MLQCSTWGLDSDLLHVDPHHGRSYVKFLEEHTNVSLESAAEASS